MKSTEEEQLDILLSVANDFNRGNVAFTRERSSQLAQIQAELENMLEQEQMQSMDMEEEVVGRDLSVEEIQRILDLPSHAIDDIRARQVMDTGQPPVRDISPPTTSTIADDVMMSSSVGGDFGQVGDYSGGHLYPNASPESGISSGGTYSLASQQLSPPTDFQYGSPHSSSANHGSPSNLLLSRSPNNAAFSVSSGSPNTNMASPGSSRMFAGSPGGGYMFAGSPGSNNIAVYSGPNGEVSSVTFNTPGFSPVGSYQSGYGAADVSSHHLMSVPGASQSGTSLYVQGGSPSSQTQGSPASLSVLSPESSASDATAAAASNSQMFFIVSSPDPDQDMNRFVNPAEVHRNIRRNSNNNDDTQTFSTTTTTTPQGQRSMNVTNIEIPYTNYSSAGQTMSPRLDTRLGSESIDVQQSSSWQEPDFSGFTLPGSLTLKQTSPRAGHKQQRSVSLEEGGGGRLEEGTSSPSVTVTTTSQNSNVTLLPVNVGAVVNSRGDTEYFCTVCRDKAGKHSYYGGQVCASCRAFFRRSVQTKYYELFKCKKEENCPVSVSTRKNCQFCRFKKCLNNGMKVSWVLSDEERNRRFNKFHKAGGSKQDAQMLAVQKFNPQKASLVVQPTLAFTMEEFNVLDDVLKKYEICKDTFVHNIITMSKTAVASLIANAYDIKPIEYHEFQCIMKTMNLILTNTVLPQFSEMNTLSYVDRNVIMKNQTIRIFKAQLCIDTDDETPKTDCKLEVLDDDDEAAETKAGVVPVKDTKIPCTEKAPSCPMKKHVRCMSMDKSLMNTLGLEEKLAKLEIDKICPKLPKYKSLYRTNWAGDSAAEERHRELTLKITCWPVINKQMDPKLIALMTTILMFNVEPSELVDRASVEQVQLKYLLLLKRYLKSVLPSREANDKFLEAMYLLSYTKELRDLEELHVYRSRINC